MSRAIRLAVILGSNREGRVGDAVAEWFLGELKTRNDISVDFIDVVDLDLPTMHRNEPTDELKLIVDRIGAAEAYVAITPEYNRGYPSALKNLIDHAYSEWFAKPAAIISYGGVSGGLRAAEQLRQVFGELHVCVIRDAVSIHGIGDKVVEGHLLADAHMSQAAQQLVDRLMWWATALSEARDKYSYAV